MHHATETDLKKPQPAASPIETATGFDAPSLASATSETISEPPQQFVSAGQQVHKWGTYLGVDWLFNTATGVTFAYWGKYTKTGRMLWSEPLTKGFETALKPLIKHPEQLKASAGYGTMFMSIIAGGMFTIPPLMVLENNHNKHKITEFIDRVVYGKKAVSEDPKFKTAYEAIDAAPKKDFTSGMWSRYASLAPELAIILIPTTKKITNKYYFNHIEHASEVAAKKLGLTVKKLFPKLTAAEGAGRMKFIHESIAMDLGLGLPYAIMHSILYKKFSAHKAEKAATNNTPEPVVKTPADAPPQTEPAELSPKNWTAHIGEKPQPMAATKLTPNFSDRLADKNSGELRLT